MNYNEYVTVVKNALTEYGATCKLIKKDDEEFYDPLTNEYTSSDTVIEGKGVLNTIDFSLIDGTSIQYGDVKILCLFQVTPCAGDLIELGNRKYNVVSVNVCNPDGNTDIYYEVLGR